MRPSDEHFQSSLRNWPTPTRHTDARIQAQTHGRHLRRHEFPGTPITMQIRGAGGHLFRSSQHARVERRVSVGLFTYQPAIFSTFQPQHLFSITFLTTDQLQVIPNVLYIHWLIDRASLRFRISLHQSTTTSPRRFCKRLLQNPSSKPLLPCGLSLFFSPWPARLLCSPTRPLSITNVISQSTSGLCLIPLVRWFRLLLEEIIPRSTKSTPTAAASA